MDIVVHDPNIPLIELPLLHEARVPPSGIFALGLVPYDVVVLNCRVPCRLVPEANIKTGQICVAEPTLRALADSTAYTHALPPPVTVTITTLANIAKPHVAGVPATTKLDEAETVHLVESEHLEDINYAKVANASAATGGFTGSADQANRSLSRHLARVWCGLHVSEGCMLFATVHGKVCCYRIHALKSKIMETGSSSNSINNSNIDGNGHNSLIGNCDSNYSSSSSSASSDSPKWCTLGRNTTMTVTTLTTGGKYAAAGGGRKSATLDGVESTNRLGLAREPFAGALDELFGMLRLAMQSTSVASYSNQSRMGGNAQLEAHATNRTSNATSEGRRRGVGNSTSDNGSILLPRGALVAGPRSSGKSALVALLMAEIEEIEIANNVRFLHLSGLDLVLDPDPRALLRQTRMAAQAPISPSSASRSDKATSRSLSLVIIDDMDNLLAASGDSQDGNEDNEGSTGTGTQERTTLAVLKAFLDDLASDQAAAVAATENDDFASESNDERHRPTPVVFVVGVGSSSSGGGGSRPGAAAGLLRVGRMERLIQLPPPSEANRADVCAALLQRAGQRGVDKEKYKAGEEDWGLARRVAAATPGFVAGDLVRLIDAAQLFAIARKNNRSGGSNNHSGLVWADIQAALVDVRPSELTELDVRRFPTREQGGPSWDDFGGYPALKAQVMRAVLGPWQAPDAHAALGVPSLSGALLHGPSGCGKSLLATIIAAECRANFVHVKSTELLSKWLGESERLVRRLFARARAAAPCVLFFDDLDALFGKRDLEGGGSGGSSGGVEQRLLTTFLNELDGVGGGAGSRGVLVLAATNRPLNCLDAALLRPGRLHESLEVGCPASSDDRAAVLRVHLQGLPLSQHDSSDVATPSTAHRDRASEIRSNSVQELEQGLQGLALKDEKTKEFDNQSEGLNNCSDNASSSPHLPGVESARRALAQSLAARTAGFTCADLAALCKDAALVALRNHLAAGPAGAMENLPPVTAEDFDETLAVVFKRRGVR